MLKTMPAKLALGFNLINCLLIRNEILVVYKSIDASHLFQNNSLPTAV